MYQVSQRNREKYEENITILTIDIIHFKVLPKEKIVNFNFDFLYSAIGKTGFYILFFGK